MLSTEAGREPAPEMALARLRINHKMADTDGIHNGAKHVEVVLAGDDVVD